MSLELNASTVEIKQLSVSLNVIKVGQKQLTLSVLKQLPNKSLLKVEMDNTGNYIFKQYGTPWGWVKYVIGRAEGFILFELDGILYKDSMQHAIITVEKCKRQKLIEPIDLKLTELIHTYICYCLAFNLKRLSIVKNKNYNFDVKSDFFEVEIHKNHSSNVSGVPYSWNVILNRETYYMKEIQKNIDISDLCDYGGYPISTPELMPSQIINRLEHSIKYLLRVKKNHQAHLNELNNLSKSGEFDEIYGEVLSLPQLFISV